MLSLRRSLLWASLAGSCALSTFADIDAIVDVTTGNTSLIVAAGNNDTTTVLADLLAGANPNIQDKLGNTALHIAAKDGYDAVINIILFADVDTSIKNGAKSDQNTALMEAVLANCSACVTGLMAKGANSTITGYNGTTAFSPAGYAAAAGLLPILQSLAPSSSSPALNSTVGGMQPIHWAAKQGQNSTLAYLLSTGANANVLVQAGNTDKGATPLLLAINGNSTDCAQTLLNLNANATLPGTLNGSTTATTPMKLSIDKGLLTILQTMVTNNPALLTAPISAGGYSPLGYATVNGNDAVATYLLVNLSAPLGQTISNSSKDTYYNLTAPHVAAYLGHTTVLQSLLSSASTAMGLATGPASCYDVGLAAVAGDRNDTLDWILGTLYAGGVSNFGVQNWTLCDENANCTGSGAKKCGITDWLTYAKARNAANTKLVGDKPNLATQNSAKKVLQYLRGKLFAAHYDGY